MSPALKVTLIVICLPATVWAANRAPVVSKVHAQQRPGTMLVDVSYDVFDADADELTIRLDISDDGGRTYRVPVRTVSGDVGPGIASGTGKTIEWDAGIDLPGRVGTSWRPRVIADDGRDRAATACIPSGDHSSIQNALTREGSHAVLCPNAVFELSDTIFFTQDDQHIYTQGLPTKDSRALLRVIGKDVATAVSAEGNNYVSIKHVIIDGNRPELGIADGALINFGRGIEDRYALAAR